MPPERYQDSGSEEAAEIGDSPESLSGISRARRERRELLAVYQDHVDGDADIERVRDAFLGKFDSEEAWAADWLEQTGSLQDG